MVWRGLTLVALCIGCGYSPATAAPTPSPPPLSQTSQATIPVESSSSSSSPPVAPAPSLQLEPDGNDESTSSFPLPARGHFEKVGRHWAALSRICDFAVLGDALYMAHATKPLGLGGATITRYTPGERTPFSLAFNWNREGEPERGGGAGQGILRLRSIDGRLFAPDADPPYLGLGLLTGIEGYVFVSDPQGRFGAARLPGHLPPRKPSAEKPGAAVLPGVLHGFDVIRFRGKLYGSSSAAIPPNGSAKSSPGTLLSPSKDLDDWQVAFTYAGAPGEESVRLSYMTRFRDRLYVAISPLYGFDRNDFLVIAPARDATSIAPADARAVRVTRSGGAHTLRWYTDRGKLYWIAIGRDGMQLWVSDDGDAFRLLELPPAAGGATDVLRVGERLLVLTEGGLYRLEGEGFELYGALPATEKKTPFGQDDGYCAAPLVAFHGAVYAGDQLRGNLYQLVAD
jgi:hypothetical protein